MKSHVTELTCVKRDAPMRVINWVHELNTSDNLSVIDVSGVIAFMYMLEVADTFRH